MKILPISLPQLKRPTSGRNDLFFGERVGDAVLVLGLFFTTVGHDGQRSACSGVALGRPRFESPPLMWRARAPPPPAPYIRKNVDFSGIGSCPCNFLSHSGPGRSVLQFFAGRMPFEKSLKKR